MQRELQPWNRVLEDATAPDHIVQLYQDQDFLSRAVCRFGCAALANGESFLLVSTRTHWNAWRPRLEAEGVNVEAARKRGQMTVFDAEELLSRFMRDGMPDPPTFLDLAADVVREARAGGRYPRVRWWGEMVNVLWERGNVAASMKLEDLFDQYVAKKDGVAIACGFLMDNFDSDIQARMLPRLGTNHSHLIPVEDYARLARAVADAILEEVGPEEARVVEDRLLSGYRQAFDMPRAEALLLALRQVRPNVADAVLQRSGELYAASGAA
jgi:MEDS: MEthanogen/methylotroph, DcmR Sensory domain